jgi:serine protease AprX
MERHRSNTWFGRLTSVAAIGTLLATAGIAGSALTQVSGALSYDQAALADLDDLAGFVGARDLWACGFGGAGIDVALIDTGVTPMPGTGRLAAGPDLSFDAQTNSPAHLDLFGHGTHLASLINGRDPQASPPTTCRATSANTAKSNEATLPGITGFAGMAPDSRVISLKAGAADGAVDVTQVVAAIDWAVENRTTDGRNIRVIAIPYGTNSTNPASSDPLSHAVSEAVRAGIVVVAAAGNDGTTKVDLAFPARNPDVITVGAADRLGTVDATQWTVASFSDRGTVDRTPDVLVPGVDVPGLRVPGSWLDQTTSTQGNRFIRGSGTSQSTAVVAGVAAQLVQKYPAATPAQVKDMLVSSTWSAKRGQVLGSVPVLYANKIVKAQPRQNVSNATLATTGTGPVEALRVDGTFEIAGVPLTGEVDVQGRSFTAWAPAATAQTAWNVGSWLGGTYTGTPTATTVPTAAWSASWSGQRWNKVEGYGGTWDGIKWSGIKWSGSTWDGIKWSGIKWSGIKWSGTTWDGIKWSGIKWSGIKWSGTTWA